MISPVGWSCIVVGFTYGTLWPFEQTAALKNFMSMGFYVRDLIFMEPAFVLLWVCLTINSRSYHSSWLWISSIVVMLCIWLHICVCYNHIGLKIRVHPKAEPNTLNVRCMRMCTSICTWGLRSCSSVISRDTRKVRYLSSDILVSLPSTIYMQLYSLARYFAFFSHVRTYCKKPKRQWWQLRPLPRRSFLTWRASVSLLQVRGNSSISYRSWELLVWPTALVCGSSRLSQKQYTWVSSPFSKDAS